MYAILIMLIFATGGIDNGLGYCVPVYTKYIVLYKQPYIFRPGKGVLKDFRGGGWRKEKKGKYGREEKLDIKVKSVYSDRPKETQKVVFVDRRSL